MIIRAFITLSSVFILFCFIFIIYTYIFPLFLAIILSLFIYPFIKFLKTKFSINHFLACILAIFIFLLSFVLVSVIIVVELIDGVIYLAKWLPEPFQQFLEEMTSLFNEWFLPLIQKVMHYMDSLSNEQRLLMKEQLDEISISMADQFASLLEFLLNTIGTYLTQLPGFFIIFFFSLICTFFILKDIPKLKEFMYHHVASTYFSLSSKLYNHIKLTLLRYMKAQFFLISISFITIFIGLICLQIKHALTISTLIAIFDLLPFLGTGIIFIPWIFYLFVTNKSLLALFLLLLYILIIVQRQLLEPKLIADALGVHPLLTILSIYLGFQLFGIHGIWVGPCTLFLSKGFYDIQIFHMIWSYIHNGTINVDKE
jgi:sporulation integral membrane protein YtvI